MKKRNGLLAVLVIFFCASISYGQTDYEMRINCGDSNSTNHGGESYQADNQVGYTYTGNDNSTTGHSGFTLDNNPGEIFVKTRYTHTIPSMQYYFPVQDGDYEVILHWAEPYHGPGLSGNPADHRQFDVQINGGNLEEDNLCVFCEAGINTPLVNTYQVIASGGSGITIDFIDQNKNDPIINAIEVLGVAPANIPVTSVSLSTSNLDLEIGGTAGQLNANILPTNATDQSVTWSSSPTNIVSVGANGAVTAITVGTTTVTVETTDGNYTAQRVVVVTDPNAPSTPAGDLWQTYDDIGAFLLTGNVGIGTQPQTAFRLAVDGKIRTKEVQVDLDTWPDYVFEKGYNVPTLEEVKKHIDEKGHLINMPSAEDVAANGIELGEMNKLLLEKIEELTLYILEQEERISRLEKDSAKK